MCSVLKSDFLALNHLASVRLSGLSSQGRASQRNMQTSETTFHSSETLGVSVTEAGRLLW